MNNALPNGKTLDGGRYTITQTLGQGGFSFTYLAENRMGKKFTVKEFFIGRYCKREENDAISFHEIDAGRLKKLKEKFAREGQLLLKIEAEKHKHIVRALDIFSENNTSYLILEYIEGRTLKKVIDESGPLSHQQAAPWLFQIGSALSTLHRNSFYHLDVKPANIIINDQDQAVLIDFGLSKEVADDQKNQFTSLAYTGGYAPPEQEDGSGKPNARMDIYALAATGYFMLTGKTPQRVDQNDYSIFSGDLSYLKGAFAKGLAVDPASRQSTVFSLLQDLGIDEPGGQTIIKEKKKIEKKKPGSKKPQYVYWAIPLLLLGVFAIYHFTTNPGPPSNDDSYQQTLSDSLTNEDQKAPLTNNGDKKEEEKTDEGSEEEPKKPAPVSAAPRYAHGWKGKIQKTTGKKEHDLIRLEYNIGEGDKVEGICVVTDADNPAKRVVFHLSGYLNKKRNKLHLDADKIIEKNMDYCLFTGDFSYREGTNTLEAERFKPKTGTASGNSCSPFRTNTNFILQKI